MSRKLILASSSPRRKELLKMLGLRDVEIRPAKGEEIPPADAEPEQIVKALSAAKAMEVAKKLIALNDHDRAIVESNINILASRQKIEKAKKESARKTK